MNAPSAPYSAPEANATELAHIHPGLRHLAVPIDAVHLDPANVNTHPDEQLEVLKAMLAEFGQRSPLITRASTGVLEAGEGRILAARSLGWRWIAVLPCDDDAITAMRFALGDNRSASLAVIDEERLAEQLLALHEQGSNLAAIGWSEEDLGVYLDDEQDLTELDEPEAGEPPAEPWTKPGDLIELGPHRLICGDCTDQAVIARLMQGETADLVWEDPPYGVAYDGKETKRDRIANDDLGFDGTRDLIRAAVRAWPLKVAGAFYVCSSPGIWETAFRVALMAEAMRVRRGIVWAKHHFVINYDLNYHYKHETILYGSCEARAPSWYGPNNEPTVWEAKKPHASKFHPTEKPVELPARAIRNSSQRGEIVFDGFGGSGTTLLAAHQLGRLARLVELEPKYCDVIVLRARELGLEAVVDRPGVGRLAWGST